MRPNNQQRIWVIGGGKFGSLAVMTLLQTAEDAEITVVDREDIKTLPPEVLTIHADGIGWFTDNFSPEADVDIVIPALPVHLAAEWLKGELTRQHFKILPVKLPDELLMRLPNPFPQGPNQAAISHADFLCPPNCAEPESICTHTRKTRPTPLYTILENVGSVFFTPQIIRSRQLAPGVGGFYRDDLFNLLKNTLHHPQTPLLIGTSCKCHGIIDGIEFS